MDTLRAPRVETALQVRPDRNRWIVLLNGEMKASFVTRTRAVAVARAWAKAVRGTLTVADANGRVLEQRHYAGVHREGD